MAFSVEGELPSTENTTSGGGKGGGVGGGDGGGGLGGGDGGGGLGGGVGGGLGGGGVGGGGSGGGKGGGDGGGDGGGGDGGGGDGGIDGGGAEGGLKQTCARVSVRYVMHGMSEGRGCSALVENMNNILTDMLELARIRRHRGRKVALRPAERVCRRISFYSEYDVIVVVHEAVVGVILAVNVAQQLYFCKQIVNAVSVNVGFTHEPHRIRVIRIVVIVIGVVKIVARCII